MMKMKIYLETSVPNFLFADDALGKKKITEQFFKKEIKKYDIFISQLVITEINKAPKEKKAKLNNVIKKYEPKLLDISQEAKSLAESYIKAGIIPKKYSDDALHIAVAVVNKMDVLVSWNMKHIVKLKTIIEVNKINEKLGYKKILINTPEEVLE